MGGSQRRKGADFERRIAADLRSIGLEARRGRQDYSGQAEPDVVVDSSGLPLDPWIECKCGRHPPLWPALDQALEAAGEGRSPIVVAHRDRGPTWALLEWGELLALLRIAMGSGDG